MCVDRPAELSWQKADLQQKAIQNSICFEEANLLRQLPSPPKLRRMIFFTTTPFCKTLIISLKYALSDLFAVKRIDRTEAR
jgi:hypothetical protein